ncbi:hypothetical protein CDD81_3211 [Ophiocordyceps australis]|uniref:Probable aspartic-type endopeptidase OPSB n=1 Tax=Ophiocordyceps australis TaxID=1399860 RepID=A0A2C5XQ71_9HYPO|nr:hypothetical protein CDD81_3211 [Ophiocordyceps australis]
MKAFCWFVKQSIISSTVLGQVVLWNISKRYDVGNIRHLVNSGPSFKTDIKNDLTQGGYFATVNIGTPGQELTLQLDTGSSDVWVPSASASICHDKREGGCSLGSFDPTQSSTFSDVGKNLFQISYLDKSSSTGDYFTDRIQLGPDSLENFTMGLGTATSVSYGLVGVGYVNNEASADTIQQLYPNLPVALANAKLINTVAYSLWLNDLDASTGNILFGGVDTEEFIGPLTRIPILLDKTANNYTSFMVSLYSIEASSSSGHDILTTQELPLPVVLDSGTSLSFLPPDLVDQVWAEVGAKYDEDVGLALLPCAAANSEGYFSFTFSGPLGPRINVTMAELVFQLSGGSPKPKSGHHRGKSVCGFGISKQSAPPYLLGDTFLRSAYVVYDLVNNEIGIAQTNFNSTKSNVVAFASRGATIPSATAAPDYDGSVPPQPTQTDLNAAKGFQDVENVAIFPNPRSGPGLTVIIMAVAFALL